MKFKRNKQLEEVLYNIDYKNFKKNTKSIILINEIFGSGKSYFINDLLTEIEQLKTCDILISFKNEEKSSFFTEVFSLANIKFISQDDQSFLKFDESNYNYSQFKDLIYQIQRYDNNLFNKLTNFLILKSSSEYFTNLKTNEEYQKEKEQLISEVRDIINQQGIIRLVFESNKVVIESLIVDLLNLFYPFNESNQILEDFIGKYQKPNITLVFDDYESIGHCINNWIINDFFHYAFNAKLDEFITYDLKNISGELKVSDFFDFKFVISTRENLILSKKYITINKYTDKILRIALPPLQKNEIIEYLSYSGINLNEQSIDIEKISKGNFFILELIKEIYKIGNFDNDLNLLYNKTSDLIFEFYSIEHTDWIRAACYLDIIDEQGLRCFPMISENYKLAYKFLTNSTDLLNEQSLQRGIFEIHPLIKEFVKKSLKIDSIQTSIELENISKIYNEIKDTIRLVKNEDLESIRNLAYFKKFPLDINIERNLVKNLDSVIKIKDNYPSWFITNKHTISLNQEKSNQFNLFNKLIDTDNYKNKIEQAKKIWNDYQNNLNKELEEINNKINELNKENQIAGKGVTYNKQQFEELQRNFIEKENKLIELRKRLSTFSITKPLTAVITNISLAGLVVLISFLFPTMFENIENENSIFAIQVMLYILSLIFVGFSGIFVFKIYQIFKSKPIIIDIEKEIKLIEEDKNSIQEEMKRINFEKEQIPKKISDINQSIVNLQNKINVINDKLKEPFI